MSSHLKPTEQNHRLLIGAYTKPNQSSSEGLHIYRLDISSGKLVFETIIEDMPNVSFMAKHSRSGLIYAVNETEEFEGTFGGGVSVLSQDYNILHKQVTGGVHPCYISIEKTGRFALVANYTSGSIAMLPIAADGRLLPASDVVQHSGSSVHPERQEGPHPHCILPDPSNRFAVVADLGLDKLLVYRMDLEAGKLLKHAEVKLGAGSGPRHFIFSSSGQYAYLLNELNSTLIVYEYDFETGGFTQLQVVSTLPADFSGENYPSDLHLSPNDKHLYLCNRGHDSIVCFKVDTESGRLAYQSHIASGGHYPRIFAIDPSGRFMVAVHQKSNNTILFQVDRATGDLSNLLDEVAVSRPVHILFA